MKDEDSHISMDDLEGNWTTDTIDGKSLIEYASEIGSDDIDILRRDWTIREDRSTMDDGTVEYDGTLTEKYYDSNSKKNTHEGQILILSNGFYILDWDIPVEFDKSSDTLKLSFSVTLLGEDGENVNVKMVMKRN